MQPRLRLPRRRLHNPPALKSESCTQRVVRLSVCLARSGGSPACASARALQKELSPCWFLSAARCAPPGPSQVALSLPPAMRPNPFAPSISCCCRRCCWSVVRQAEPAAQHTKAHALSHSLSWSRQLSLTNSLSLSLSLSHTNTLLHALTNFSPV